MTSDSSRLDELRGKLREVDEQIIDLIAERLNIVKGIGSFKKSRGLAIQDDIQERKNLNANIARAKNQIPLEMVEELTNLLAAWGRKHQE